MHKESLKRKFIHNFFKLLFFSVYSEAYLNESLEFIRNWIYFWCDLLIKFPCASYFYIISNEQVNAFFLSRYIAKNLSCDLLYALYLSH